MRKQFLETQEQKDIASLVSESLKWDAYLELYCIAYINVNKPVAH